MILARVIEDREAFERAAATLEVSEADGAQVVFRGVVRNHNQGRAVTAVSYDAFVPLTERVFGEIAAEARARWGGGLSLTILHRTGRLAVGEASVVVAAASPHRGESFEAARYVIDELKTRAPIWKQEHYVDGESEWLPGHALCQGHAHEGAHP
jgi:molybdopterin synthase catalytic subunit